MPWGSDTISLTSPEVSVVDRRIGNFSKPSRAGEVGSDGFGKHGTRTQCTASTAGAKFAHAAGL